MDLQEKKRHIAANMRDCSVISGEVHRLIQKTGLSPKEQTDLVACVDVQNQMIRRLTLVLSALITDEDPWEASDPKE